MWICLKDSFLSLSEKYCNANELMVRARSEGHIEKIFPDAKVKFDPSFDYWYTAVVPREDVALAIAGRIRAIEPGPFKDDVKDIPLKTAYYEVWAVMETLQGGSEYDEGS